DVNVLIAIEVQRILVSVAAFDLTFDRVSGFKGDVLPNGSRGQQQNHHGYDLRQHAAHLTTFESRGGTRKRARHRSRTAVRCTFQLSIVLPVNLLRERRTDCASDPRWLQ